MIKKFHNNLLLSVLRKIFFAKINDDLKEIVNKTYTSEVFGYNRSNQNPNDITPTLKLKDNLY